MGLGIDTLGTFMNDVRRLFESGMITQAEARAIIQATAQLLGIPSTVAALAVSAA